MKPSVRRPALRNSILLSRLSPSTCTQLFLTPQVSAVQAWKFLDTGYYGLLRPANPGVELAKSHVHTSSIFPGPFMNIRRTNLHRVICWIGLQRRLRCAVEGVSGARFEKPHTSRVSVALSIRPDAGVVVY